MQKYNQSWCMACVCAYNAIIWNDTKKQDINSEEYSFLKFSFKIST